MSDPLDALEEALEIEQKQAVCDVAAADTYRYFKSLLRAGFDRSEALQVVVANTGRPIGMSPDQMGQMVRQLLDAIDEGAAE